MPTANAPTTLDVHLELLRRAGRRVVSTADKAHAIASELLHSLPEVYRNENNRAVAKTFLESLVTGATLSLAIAHAFPTMLRWAVTTKQDPYYMFTSPREEVIGLYGGEAAAFAVCMATYAQLAQNGHPEALFLPAATNLISGVYELQRMYRDAVRSIRQDLAPNPSAPDISGLV